MSDELLLIGSIPLDTPKDVFETFGTPLGRYLFAMPDGEVGPRRHWISRVHYQVLAAHPELEIVQRPAPDENGVERQHPRSAADAWWFKVKPGVKQVRFGDPGWRLGYARDAVNSYFVFKTLKEKGVLPPHLRFQVSMPMVNSVLPPRIFPDRAIWRRSAPATKRPFVPNLPRLSKQSRRTSLRSSGTARPKFTMPTAASRAIPCKERSSAIWPRCATCLRTFHPRSRSDITSASARLVAGHDSDQDLGQR